MPSPTPRQLVLGCLVPLALLAAACAEQAPPLAPEAADPLAAAGGPHVVHVAPPTGIVEQDRASILAALEEVRPGGTVQFAPGTYLIGFDTPFNFDFIRVTVPRITLLGHPAGTTLRGCNPEEFVFVGCNGLELTGGHQTVRNLTFESFWWPLFLGREFAVDPDGNWFFDPIESGPGGYRIEDNTFRSIIGVTMYGRLQQPSLIRNNTFLNVWHAMVVRGGVAHFVDNDVSAPEPEQVPFFGHPGNAVGIVPNYHAPASSCDHNVVARNRFDGFPQAIAITIPPPGVTPTVTATCRHNVIRDNTVLDTHGSLAMPNVGIQLQNYLGPDGRMEQNLIANNTIHGVSASSSWGPGGGNGSGIWILPWSSETRILNNRFTDVELEEVVLECDHNHVATTSASDVVRDLGIGNRVTGPGSVVTTATPAGASAAAAASATERAEAARRPGEHFGAWGQLLGREAARGPAPR
jgi:hypothetical protein